MQKEPNIWLVDDDPAIIDIVKQAFEKQQLSCRVKGFITVQAIIAALEDTPHPTLLMIDYSMPSMDGLELIQWIKLNPKTHSLKVILFSQFLSKQLINQALTMGVYEVTSKPFSFSEWCILVKDLCLAGHFD
ncbi:response regulator [Larkinella terrae]|uniref:Response regulator n=1 Tax=Larkinella terrae TaxID=2025311 RepID=A0A7K0EHI8_9BACT|nr:response regulator [Larkinella terrae]MRS60916.1 response regulator [Larkinella terrae]